MVFAAAISVLLLYFIRPQDWIPGMAGFNVVRPVMAMSILGLMSRTRSRKGPSPLPFMTTPHEWVMLVYLLYILFTSPDGMSVFTDLLALGLFFFVTMHGTYSSRLLLSFLNYWKWALVVVVSMGLGVLYGFDYTQSAATTAEMQGRLSLRHWMLNNPNALGHTLITLLPLLYYTMFKEKSFISKGIAIGIAALAGICLWHTLSKGAYLVGGIVLVFAVVLGRPWWVKVGVLAVALGGGQAVLSTLPRMSEMNSLRSNEGVVGRLMAWEVARNVTKYTTTGEGWKKFEAVIDWEGAKIDKATHSAYVKIGADLGVPGLLLYMSLICCGFRTLITYMGHDKRMETIRRILFCLLLSYAISGWMIDRAYHTEFFLILGAIASYHGLSIRQMKMAQAPSPANATGLERPVRVPFTPRQRRPRRRRSPFLAWLITWRRYSVSDVILACLALQSVLYTWDYVMLNL